MLIHSVYNDDKGMYNGHSRAIPLIRPKITKHVNVHIWYDPNILYTAWKIMIERIEDERIPDTLRYVFFIFFKN